MKKMILLLGMFPTLSFLQAMDVNEGRLELVRLLNAEGIDVNEENLELAHSLREIGIKVNKAILESFLNGELKELYQLGNQSLKHHKKKYEPIFEQLRKEIQENEQSHEERMKELNCILEKSTLFRGEESKRIEEERMRLLKEDSQKRMEQINKENEQIIEQLQKKIEEDKQLREERMKLIFPPCQRETPQITISEEKRSETLAGINKYEDASRSNAEKTKKTFEQSSSITSASKFAKLKRLAGYSLCVGGLIGLGYQLLKHNFSTLKTSLSIVACIVGGLLITK